MIIFKEQGKENMRTEHKTAIITGVLGQSGSYLAELLLEKDYNVVGLHRRSSKLNTENIETFKEHPNFSLLCADLTDAHSVSGVISEYKPDELYNLGAMSFVGASFTQPAATFQVNTIGTINCLEAIRQISPETRYYQASTSEMFARNYSESPVQVDKTVIKEGKCSYLINGEWTKELPQSPEKYQDENTPFGPQSAYGVSKVAAHEMTTLYRRSYGLHTSCGILFNHESPRRGEEFVTRKITKYIGNLIRWKNSLSDDLSIYTNENYDSIWTLRKDGYTFGPQFPKLGLGNIQRFRDWGHAKDYVRAMWLMLQQDTPDDYVISTGQIHSIEQFLEKAFCIVGLDYRDYYMVDPKFYRPAEVDYLRGRSDKARKILGWQPEISFDELVCEMVEWDLNHE